MNPALRGSSAHVFVESLAAPRLDDADRHHLLRVLRLRSGAEVTATDGAGRWMRCELAADGELVPASSVVDEPVGERLTVATAIPKGDRPELVVQKLTEIGVDRIVLVATARSVVRWDGDRVVRQLARLRKVAREAAMQSRRVRLPEVDGVAVLSEVLDRSDVVVAEPGGRPIAAGDMTVVVGPEGGFAPGELPDEVDRVGLGPHVLRVETAAIVAATLMVASHRR